jgi:protein ImuB
MKRILAIWLPNWPIQRRRNNRPELAGRPVILQAPSRRGQAVAACSAEAAAAGIRPGMPIAEALVGANPRHTVVELHDPAADRRALEDLARWCHQFSPTVGLEDTDEPEMLLVDATRLAPLYGGEPALVRQVAAAFKRRNLDARLALADTLGAAWALAHYSPCHPEVFRRVHAASPRGADSSAALGVTVEDQLAPLPLAALRLPPDLLETLADLGLAQIADLVALPREQLRSRFGPLLATRIDQALGAASEVIVAVEPPPDFTVEHAFDFPIARQEAIRYAIEHLLRRLGWLLSARNAGALRLRCRFDCEGGPPVAVEFDLFQPTARVRHLLEILDLHLERVRLPAPAAAITLRVLRHAPLAQRQSRLFETQRTLATSRRLAALVDRLAGRLGGEAVVRCSLQSDVQPELAYREEPLVAGSSRTPLVSQSSMTALDRPLCLLSRPAALDAISVVPDGPPIHFSRSGERHEVARYWGPERIETGWWRRTSAWRDYYRVETSEGRRFWLFRRRRDGRWFLHGAFE